MKCNDKIKKLLKKKSSVFRLRNASKKEMNELIKLIN